MTTPPRQGRHVVANGIRLHFVRLGNGRPPLILLPGITSPAVTWEFVAASLAARNDVYVLDNGTVSEADAEVFVTALRSGHKQRIDGAGHMIPWDQFDLFVRAVHAFLLTDDRSGGGG